MPLTHLSITYFRNIEALDWEPVSGLNVLEGENAQGKTNLLEAVYFLANGRSFRTQEHESLICFGNNEARLQAALSHEDLSSRLEIHLNREGQERRLQGKPITRLGKVHALFRVLVFTPDSSALFRGAPALRRRYLDHAISMHRPAYGKMLSRYLRTLKQRNQLLEGGGFSELQESFDVQWAEAASQVMQERMAYLEELLPVWKHRLATLTGDRWLMDAKWEGRLWSVGALREAPLLEILRETRAEERRYRRTVVGPQRDDLGVSFHQHPVREAASQGQQRMLVIALKLAEADLFQSSTGRSPMFLLDDLGSELDSQHLGRLLEMLEDIQAQTILTTAQEEMYRSLKAKTFRIKEGNLTPI